MAVKRIALQGAVLALPAPAKKSAAVAKNQTEAKSKKAAAAPREFSAPARGTAVEVRSRIARALSGRWLVIYVRAEVVSAASGAGSSYVVRYPAYNGVPAEDVREPRRVRATPAARPASSKRSSTETAESACKKAKIRTGQGIPMDALRRYMEEVKAQYPDAELPPTRKHP